MSLPKDYKEALAHPGWRLAMEEKMKALCDRGTWELQALLEKKEVVGCRRLFAIKYHPHGTIERLKA